MKTTFLFAVSVLATATLFGSPNKLSRDLPGKGDVDVIVQFNTLPSDADHSEAARAGARLKRKYKHIKAAVYRAPAASLQGLAKNPRVRYISPDRKVKGLLDVVVATAGAASAWQAALDGTGVGVAVVDSGVGPATDLQQAS